MLTNCRQRHCDYQTSQYIILISVKLLFLYSDTGPETSSPFVTKVYDRKAYSQEKEQQVEYLLSMLTTTIRL